MVLGCVGAKAQDTLQYNANLQYKAGVTDSFQWVTRVGLSVPTKGAGINWDYSKMKDSMVGAASFKNIVAYIRFCYAC